ncbi:MAG: M28 family peptidase, partial [Thermomicrobiales bacterium]
AHEIPCATHAFAASTGAGGLSGELALAGRGTPEELDAAGAGGRIVLVDGIIAPNRNLAVEQAGVVASIWIAGTHLHERALSPVWGTPTPETAGLLPTTPSVSVKAGEGQQLKELLASGPVEARLETRVYRGWRQLPLLVADLPLADGDGDFVLFSGHVDSWHYGAMDNGTANATMLEVAHILAQHRDELRRGLRLAFWSGHSHARYAGSAWYADEHWQELREHCVAHINVDSVGGNGATVLSEGNSMAELRGFVSDAIEPVAGQRLAARRYGRAGDQSFWGHGIPAALMSLSEQPPENADPVLLALHHQIAGGASAGGGLGWWWHTPDDTVDKIDPAFLRRDASIYVLLLHRLCTAGRLPLDYRPVAADLRQNVESIAAKAGSGLDLEPALLGIDALAAALDRLDERADGLDDAAINRCLKRISRALIPVDYTRAGEFGQDLAVPTSPLPGLQPATTLATLDPDSDGYHFLRTALVRERNRLVHALSEATRAVDEVLAVLG